MLGFRKRSFIRDWWVARKDDKFKFIDITDRRNLTEDSIIVGRTYSVFPEIDMSRNSVVKVTKRGVYTAKGRFYPFSRAHPLYLMFLYQIHIPPAAMIASKWEWLDYKNNMYLANIEYPSGEKQEGVVFDLKKSPDVRNTFVGVSEMLEGTVVFNTFDMKSLSANHSANDVFPAEAYHTALEFSAKRRKAIRNVKKVFRKRKRQNKKAMGL